MSNKRALEFALPQQEGFGAGKRLRRDFVDVQVVPDIDDDDVERKADDGSGKGAATTSGAATSTAVTIEVPKPGTNIDRRVLRKTGPFIIGPELRHNHHLLGCMVQHLARKENSDQFFQLKILSLNNNPDSTKLSDDELHGKMFILKEYSLLSLLRGEEGIIQQHGLFSDIALEEYARDAPNVFYTGKTRKRLILVLDCVTPHPFSQKSMDFVNLHKYLHEKRIAENEALLIFYEIVKVVEKLHNKNIIHRDLKMANTVYNRRTRKVILTNFSLGRHLCNENEMINDRVGTPHYISPDILSDKPYKGKPADAWSLGVIFYFLLYRKLPFSEATRALLYKKIKVNEYIIPTDHEVSPETIHLIKSIFKTNPEERLTVPEIRQRVEKIVASKLRFRIKNEDQMVPDLTKAMDQPEELTARHVLDHQERRKYGFAVNAQMRNLSINTVPLRSESSYFNRPSALHPCHFTARIRPSVLQRSQHVVDGPSPTSQSQIKESIVKTFKEVLQAQRISPQALDTSSVTPFDGIVNSFVARKFVDVLCRDFITNPAVQEILSETYDGNPPSALPSVADVNRIEKFFGFAGINVTRINNESFKISREQPRGCNIYRRAIFDYILTSAGFSTLFFSSSVFYPRPRVIACVPVSATAANTEANTEATTDDNDNLNNTTTNDC